jgi:hypothetical protein
VDSKKIKRQETESKKGNIQETESREEQTGK